MHLHSDIIQKHVTFLYCTYLFTNAPVFCATIVEECWWLDPILCSLVVAVSASVEKRILAAKVAVVAVRQWGTEGKRCGAPETKGAQFHVEKKMLWIGGIPGLSQQKWGFDARYAKLAVWIVWIVKPASKLRRFAIISYNIIWIICIYIYINNYIYIYTISIERRWLTQWFRNRGCWNQA